MATPANFESISVADRARRRITWRLMPFLLLLFVLAFLDRTNLSVAKLQMGPELGLNDSILGVGAGVFFLGYFLLEIPGTLIVERWSARKWIARIMVSWGIIAALMGLIGLPVFAFLGVKAQFYSLRFLLGLAEAGFFPGVIVYLAHWFRYEDRAKTKSFFLIGIPLATIISTPLSQLIMNTVQWQNLAGWRWVFILEGIPAIILGFVTYFYLTDRPNDAKWLPEDERAWIVAEIEKEHQAKVAAGGAELYSGLKNPHVWLLATIYFFAVTGMYGLTFFLPSIVDKFKDTSVLAKTTISTLPYVLGFIAILINGANSDRTSERRWHTALPLLLAGISMGFCAIFSTDRSLSIVFLSLVGITLYAYIPVFWTHPSSRLTASSAALAVGLINSVGNLGGFVGPMIVGKLKDSTKSYAAGLWFLTACIFAAGVLALLLTNRKPAKNQLLID